jgi:hypothetical protein
MLDDEACHRRLFSRGWITGCLSLRKFWRNVKAGVVWTFLFADSRCAAFIVRGYHGVGASGRASRDGAALYRLRRCRRP